MKKGCTKTRGLLRSANANNGANAGSFYVNSNNAPSNTNANIGSHLCLIRKIGFCGPCQHGKKRQILTEALVLKRKKTLRKAKQ